VSAQGYSSDRRARLERERIQAQWASAYAPSRHLDLVLIGSVLLLTVIGVVMIYSATFQRLELEGVAPDTYLVRQLWNAGLALLAFAAVAAIDYRHIRAYAAPLYLAALTLLGLVLTPLGAYVGGARRWIELGFFQLQPSEVAKVAVLVAIAALFHDRRQEPGPAAVVVVLTLAAIPAGLIVLQPDIGTALVFPVVAFVLLTVAGTKLRYLAGLVATAALGVYAVVRFELLEPYQVARLTAFLDPSNAELARTSAYNMNQSMIAVGSGGFAGKGLFQGTQTNLNYVPENHTDFIFTVVGEEFGFLGASLVLVLFALVIWRGLRIATMAKDAFGRLVAVGAIAVLTVQVFVNVGMTIGIAPITGIPLPFVSYGGTALITAYVLVGLLLNVHMRRF
jgi:rod shape determining protein RodA